MPAQRARVSAKTGSYSIACSQSIPMDFDNYLKILASNHGSDLYLSTGAPPCAKFHGAVKPIHHTPVEPGEIKEIACVMMDDQQKIDFAEDLEMTLAYSVPQVGRFRINISRQRNEVSIVARNTVTEIPSADSLG